jgi:hypothetical protein
MRLLAENFIIGEGDKVLIDRKALVRLLGSNETSRSENLEVPASSSCRVQTSRELRTWAI